jgi:DNA-binding FadR family transcriptional regulator
MVEAGPSLSSLTVESLPLEPLETRFPHEYVAEQLRRQIALHLHGSGGPLPSERDLAETFGVARKTIRKALQALGDEGLVYRRRGRAGGTFIVEPNEKDGSLERLIEQLRRGRERVEEALAFRLSVEPPAAALAAVVAGENDLDRMEDAVEGAAAAPSDAVAQTYDSEFHLALARATANQFFAASLEEVRVVLNPALTALPGTALWLERSDIEHRGILRELRTRNAEAARRAMKRHVQTTDKSVRALLSAL